MYDLLMSTSDTKKSPGLLRRLWRALLTPAPSRTRGDRRPSVNVTVQPPPDPDLLARFGQYHLLDDLRIELHGDGTTSYARHVITVLHGAAKIAEWDTVRRTYDRRIWRLTIE